ncbi:MAG TPA: hypothetical protein VJR29_01565 [bacterium]|nr:hypothetical protein [bacterium]
MAESARFGILLSGWNALEFGTYKLLLKALPPRNPALLRFSTLTEGFVRGASRLLGASTPVRGALASAGSTAGIQLSAAFAAGVALGVGLNYLPTLWGGQELSEHIAQGLEWAFGPAPEWLCEMF